MNMNSEHHIEIGWLPPSDRPWTIPVQPSRGMRSPERPRRIHATPGSRPTRTECFLEEPKQATRLPAYDQHTRGAEVAAFSSLGLVAIALIGFAVSEAGRFAVERDCVIATLSGGQVAPSQAATCSYTNPASKDLTAAGDLTPAVQLTLTPIRLGLPGGW